MSGVAVSVSGGEPHVPQLPGTERFSSVGLNEKPLCAETGVKSAMPLRSTSFVCFGYSDGFVIGLQEATLLTSAATPRETEAVLEPPPADAAGAPARESPARALAAPSAT